MNGCARCDLFFVFESAVRNLHSSAIAPTCNKNAMRVYLGDRESNPGLRRIVNPGHVTSRRRVTTTPYPS